MQCETRPIKNAALHVTAFFAFHIPSLQKLTALSKWTLTTLLFAAIGQSSWAAEPSIPYTVLPKDELHRISAEFLNTPDDWKEVAQFNRLKNAHAIRPGQVINIPTRLMKLKPIAGKLISVSGDVKLAGNKAPAGAAVPEGSTLQTGSNSSAVLELADGSRITVLPNSLAELVVSKHYGLRKAAEGGSSIWFTGLMRLSAGALDALASKTANRVTPLKIETPTSLVGVRGTQFRVGYEDAGKPSARVEVLEGKVRADITAQDNGADLTIGKGARLNPGPQEIKVVDLLKGPNLAATPSDIFKPQAFWPIPDLTGAQNFRVQISGDPDFSRIVRDAIVTNRRADFSDLPNGGWFARVRGIDPDGLEGYDSVKAVQVLLPPQSAQLPRQWMITGDQLEVVDGRHVLRFALLGLDASHAVLATVQIDKPDYLRTAKMLAHGDTPVVQMDLGILDSGAKHQLSLTVVQADGASMTPLVYQFDALRTDGTARGSLQFLPAKR